MNDCWTGNCNCTFQCEFCKQVFLLIHKGHVGDGIHIWCSDECRLKWGKMTAATFSRKKHYTCMYSIGEEFKIVCCNEAKFELEKDGMQKGIYCERHAEPIAHLGIGTMKPIQYID